MGEVDEAIDRVIVGTEKKAASSVIARSGSSLTTKRVIRLPAISSSMRIWFIKLRSFRAAALADMS